jgi:uroporphyrinogen decarboxylase
MTASPFAVPVAPDWEGFMRCIRREGVPQRVHHIELFLDAEVEQEICERFDLAADLDRTDPYFKEKAYIAVQRFLGYDFVTASLEGSELSFNRLLVQDTAGLQRAAGRHYQDEHIGPITNWAEFEAYRWPDVAKMTSRSLEWYEHNLPDDMGVIGFRGFGHLAEHLSWLMGYETLCYALYDERDLVCSIAQRVIEQSDAIARRVLEFSCVKAMWGTDDMGFRTGTLISPRDLRELILPGHRGLAEMAHAAGRPYLLHSCGNLTTIWPDLIDDVKIDAKHSFEDNIEPVTVSKRKYGDRVALLGGIDIDFLCRADEAAIRQRVRETLDVCMPGGGYCLGTGNSVANYVPVDHYLAMVDEGRRYAA